MAPSIHIAVNSRLSQSLKQQLLAEHWQAQTVAPTPRVMTLGQWWQQWQQMFVLQADMTDVSALLAPTRLSVFEAEMLWQDVLAEAMQQQPQLRLLNATATAKQLYQAWCFLIEYQAEDALQDYFKTAEVSLFLTLKQHYQQRLTELKLLDPPLVQKQQLAWLKQVGAEVHGSQFYLHGFDDVSPWVQQWIDLLTEQGALIERVKPTALSSPPHQQLCQVETPEQEAQQIAVWCADWLERQLNTSQAITESSNKALPSLGIVAPNIEAIQASLSWALDETFYQRFGQSLPLSAGRQKLYNMSLGQPLSQSAWVQNALQTLQLALVPQQTLQYDFWSDWLTSPYTLGDLQHRQQADSRLRSLQWASFKWPALLSYLQHRHDSKDPSQSIPNPLPMSLTQVLLKQSQKKRAHSVSLTQFVQQAFAALNAFRCGQNVTLNTIEMQQKQAFFEALTLFSNCFFQTQKTTFSDWLGRFKHLLQSTLHQPQTQGWVPIQIMGMLEASGQQFDGLWVMGLTDEAWPRMPKPNPFLPIAMQRDLSMPRCDAQRELTYATAITQRLAQSAPNQVWSYATHLEDKELLPSPLLLKRFTSEARSQGIQSMDFQLKPYLGLAELLKQQASPLDWVEDAQAPAMPINTLAPGGTGILSAQNQCPLMAFIDYRLGARYQLETVEEGLQANHLGTLVHQVLEDFWRATQTQAQLLAMTDETLAEQIGRLLEAAMAPMQSQYDDHYLALEKQRIQQLILDWLSLEKARPPFKVLETETAHQLAMGSLLFHTKIDRVDQLLDFANQKLIVDYKTGRAKVGDLLKEPVEAPQLAVYLYAYAPAEVAGLGYCILHSDDGVKLDFLVVETEILPGCKQVFSKLSEKAGSDYEGQAWSDFLQALRDEIAALAHSLQRGDAQMHYRDEAALDYAAGKLALRLPEVKWQKSLHSGRV